MRLMRCSVLGTRREQNFSPSKRNPLVLYSQIPLRYLYRHTSAAWDGIRAPSYQGCSGAGCRIKFNTRGIGTWMDQIVIDFGPAGTDWLIGITLDRGIYYGTSFVRTIKLLRKS